MVNQSNKQLQVNEIISYFEKENLQISNHLAGNLDKSYEIIELLKGYKAHIKNVIDKKIIHFQQLEVFLQYINDIKTFYSDLEKILQDIAKDFNTIIKILNIILDIVLKVPYVTEVKTSLMGDRFKGTEKLHFYIINHQQLINFLNNAKDLVKPKSINNIQHSPISEKLNQIIDILPFIKSEYLPNVVYANVPESLERIIILSEELRKLIYPLTFLEKNEFLKEFMAIVSSDFEKIINYFKANPEKDLIKLKGKFRESFSNFSKLYRALSFDKYYNLY